MPILAPSLDDRSYDDLVAELVARIPAHTPEWTNPAPGDPGRTLVELFAWLADTLLYRANLIPERQRLAFLRLLGQQLRPPSPATGLVTLSVDDDRRANARTLQRGAIVKAGAIQFETLTETTVLPVVAQCYYKRPLTSSETAELAPVVDGLRDVYRLSASVTPYVTTPIFVDTAAPDGFDLVARTVDRCLWVALLAPNAALRADARVALGGTGSGARQRISVGVRPTIAVPALFEEIGPRRAIPVVWEMSGVEANGEPFYVPLDVLDDTSRGLTRRGALRLALPPASREEEPEEGRPERRRNIAAPPNDVRQRLDAGVGDRPPRLDDPKIAARLVAWLRLRPATKLSSLSLSWLGVNAAEIDQRRTATNRIVGQSDGAADQEMPLPLPAVEPASLEVEVEEPGRGFARWTRIDDLALGGRDDGVYSLDAEAGTIRFGDGVRGRVPDPGMRVRLVRMRGGSEGRAGNVPPASIKDVGSALDLDGAPVAKLKVSQALATEGGEDGETLAQAERRIPALFRDRDRAVTEEDYRRLAADTPGVRMGRVELLPRFKPHQRRSEVPGIVTVMTLPGVDGTAPPAPRPDRPFLEAVHAWLDARRPVATELYVIGCEYVPLGIGASVSVRDGFGRDGVLQAVRDALRAFLWPLTPGGIDGRGWPVGRAVRERELEVVIARVPGVATVNGITLFERDGDEWRLLVSPERCGPVTVELERWQLPELLSVMVASEPPAPTDLRALPNPFGAVESVAVPVVPEVC